MKITLLFSAFVLVTTLNSYAQVKDTIAKHEVYVAVEKQPEFPGGTDAFLRYLSLKLQYPRDSWNNHIGGKVIVSFIVEPDGSITNAKILRHIADDLDAEALRVISSSIKWKPGMQNNSPVRVMYSVPISFVPSAKKDSTTAIDTTKFYPVDTPPEYPGGIDAFMKFVKQNLHSGNEQGRVITRFVVEKDGALTDIKVIKGLSEKADAEALRVIGKMPKWKPGIQGGNPVRVAYTIPIYFSTN